MSAQKPAKKCVEDEEWGLWEVCGEDGGNGFSEKLAGWVNN